MPPFALSWDNNQTGNTIRGLGAAYYKVTVVDANNCSMSKSIRVEDPAKETITDFPSNYKLCEGQRNIINPGKWATYAWFRNNIKVSDTSSYNANLPGNYKLNVISEKGCKDSASFKVETSKDVLSAKFLVPNEIVADDTIEIVDVSWPIPDKITWYVDTVNTRFIKHLTDRQQVVFKNAGEYTVKLVAQKALCISEDEQTITVYNNNKEQIDGKQPIKTPSDISELYLYPNPSRGTFTVKIRLIDIRKVTLRITKMLESNLITIKELENSDLYEVQFDMPDIGPGIYLLDVQTVSSRKSVKFVVIK